MNIDFINPFIDAVSDVLITMAVLQCNPEKAVSKQEFEDQGDVIQGDVTGIVGMVGDQFKGFVAISFTAPVALGIAERMLGEELETIDETITDLVGELTSMIAGGAKLRLSEQNCEFGMATPLVVVGDCHRIFLSVKGGSSVIPFSTEVGDFFIEMYFGPVN
ncbi:MAG: chemotaxis protein CheX [Pseudomonadales bacterium]